MQTRVFLASIAFVLTATVPVLADPPPAGFEIHSFSASHPPTTTDGITTSHIAPFDCNDIDYGDGRGESDCINGSTKSTLRHIRDQRLGETLEYRFDFWVDPGMAYAGEFVRDAVAYRRDGWDSRLRLASWEGPFIKDMIYMLKLDATDGTTFFGRVCRAPNTFGSWVSFSMKIRWANDEKGWIKVTCDDRIVYADEAVSTTAQIQCYTQNECQPGVVHDPKSFNHTVGLGLMGRGYNWQESGYPSKWTEIQPDGLTVKLRNIAVIEGAELYSADERAQVKALQEALNGLDCPVGTPDGIVGPKTRQQALACRAFPAGEKPDKLTVATVGTFLALYTRAGVAELPPGSEDGDGGSGVPGLIDAEFAVRAVEMRSRTDAGSADIGSNIVGYVDDTDFGELDLHFSGYYAAETDSVMDLTIDVGDDFGENGRNLPGKCPGATSFADEWGTHLRITVDGGGTAYTMPDSQCVADILGGTLGEKAAFLLGNFSDIAVGMAREDTLDSIVNDNFRAFMTRISTGEITITD